ncbi:MAG: 2-iminobutanoate/2-iminopropanoate deaminase [Porticoccaceae bacterium UBA1117]|nr:MAG: 2-iminobutanoate/2-iminopropanoate deaminase [Porticoccaceae bacterium UBA1117]
MNARQIKTNPDSMEPFNIAQGYTVGNLIFTSGQAAIDSEGNIVGVDDFDAQAEQGFKNLSDVLQQGGSSLAQVMKVTIYLTDMTNFMKVVALRERFFSAPYPADTLIEVSSLALPELEIEIEAIALTQDSTIEASLL